MKISFGNLWSWVAIGVLAAMSYFFLGAAYAQVQLFNSDQGIHVLMAHNPRLPEGLYMWGQHRLGSLMPILAHLLYLILPISASHAISIIQIAAPLLTIWIVRNDFQNKFTLVLFSSLMLLPPICFSSLMISCNNFSLMLLCMAITYKLIVRDNALLVLPGTMLTNVSLALVSVVGLWLSETYILFLFVISIYAFRQITTIKKQENDTSITFKLNLKYFVYFILMNVLGILGIVFAKITAFGQGVTFKLVTPSEFVEGIKMCNSFINESTTLNPNLPSLLIESYLLLIFTAFILIHYTLVYRERKITPIPLWQNILFWTLIANLFFYLFSKWSLLNGMAPRYVTLVYASGVWYVLLIPKANKSYQYLTALVSVLAISTSITYATVRFLPKYTPSYMASVAPLTEKFGKCTLLGDYYVTYCSASSNPDLITPIPSQSSMDRTPWTLDAGMENETILVSKDNFLYSFPDTLIQYNYILARYKDTVNIPYIWPNRYLRVPHKHTFQAAKWQHGYGELIKDDSAKQEYLFVKEADLNQFLCFGPYVPLTKGKFVAEIETEISQFQVRDSSFIEVFFQSNDVLSQTYFLTNSNFSNHKITIPFELQHSFPQGIELRFRYKGKGAIKIHGLKINEVRTWKYPWESKIS